MINDVLNKIKATEDCRLLSEDEIKQIDSLKDFKYVIELNTEVSLNKGLTHIVLYVGIPDPPITLPKIFINSNSYDQIKFIPHINKDLNICIYDEGVNHLFNPSKFPEMVEEMVYRAKRIISQGDDVDVKIAEFSREYKAYWEISYDENDVVNESGISIITDSDSLLRGYCFIAPFNGFKYLIYNDSELFNNFKNYLEYRGIKFKDIDIFEVKHVQKQPPFHLNFPSSIKHIEESDLRRFRQVVNKKGFESVLVVFRNNLGECFGWVYKKTIPPLEIMLRRQRRQLTQWQIMNAPEFSKSLVQRILFSNLTPNRLNYRTSGFEIDKTFSTCIVGLGSVGSNLLNLLIKLPINKYYLVDSDILKLENIYRYQYGFNFIGMAKVEVAKFNIIDKNPFSEVVANVKSIIDILNTHSSLFNEFDLNIIAIGNTMIEKYILDHLVNTDCKRPILILWVEPFLASGQLLFITSDDYSKAKNLIENYPYKVLNNANMNNVYFKEGTCQSGYFPYSESNLMLFLSSVFPFLFKFLNTPSTPKSKVLTWVGDKEFLKERGLSFTEFGANSESYDFLISDL